MIYRATDVRIRDAQHAAAGENRPASQCQDVCVQDIQHAATEGNPPTSSQVATSSSGKNP